MQTVLKPRQSPVPITPGLSPAVWLAASSAQRNHHAWTIRPAGDPDQTRRNPFDLARSDLERRWQGLEGTSRQVKILRYQQEIDHVMQAIYSDPKRRLHHRNRKR